MDAAAANSARQQDEAEQEEHREPDDRRAEHREHIPLTRDDEPDRGDRRQCEDLTHRQDGVADDLSGEQRAGRHGRQQHFDDAGLLLLHHALCDRAAEGRGGHHEDQAEADRDEVAQDPGRRGGLEDGDLGW
ncbi:hypothetical protein QFZ21_003043 [Microbacterium sp. W4I20]|nr:hypothetical protein [Microbacterium sp. W4I20]